MDRVLKFFLSFTAVFAITFGFAAQALAFGSSDCHRNLRCTRMMQDATGAWYCAGTITIATPMCTGSCSPCGYSPQDPKCQTQGDPLNYATCRCAEQADPYAPCVTCVNCANHPSCPNAVYKCVSSYCPPTSECVLTFPAPVGGPGTPSDGHCECEFP